MLSNIKKYVVKHKKKIAYLQNTKISIKFAKNI